MTSKILKYGKKSLKTLKNDGVLTLAIKSLQKIQKSRQAHTHTSYRKKQFVSLVSRDDVILADWSNTPYVPDYSIVRNTKRIAWIMSPPAGGGGHQNIFRFIDYLDSKGYSNDVYLYSMFDDTSTEQARQNTSQYSSAKNTNFYYFKNDLDVKADIIFATGWETAYPVFNLKTDALKYYFVQDFEPLFYPMGTDYILAENTYKFGFRGVTAGGWLKSKLTHDYGMTADSYDFGADKVKYNVTNDGARKNIFFYARPVTERRGFDLGLMALELFHKEMPEYNIHLAGWDVSEWNVPFPYTNHGAVAMDDLNSIYNGCSAALVMSLTNMSLLPLELLASGVVPVVNDGDNNRLVSDNKYIRYTESSPAALAKALIESVKRNENSQMSKRMSKSVPENGWGDSGEVFISIIEKDLSHGK